MLLKMASYEPIRPYKWESNELDNKINIWCLDMKGLTHLVRVEDYYPSCYIQLPPNIMWNMGMIDTVKSRISKMMREQKPIHYEVRMRKPIYFYHQYDLVYIHMRFNCSAHMHKLSRMFGKKIDMLGNSQQLIYQVCENNLSCTLKLQTEIKTLETQCIRRPEKALEEEETISIAEYEYLIGYGEIKPIPVEETNHLQFPIKTLSFDIETYSGNHKAFPFAGYSQDEVFIITCVVEVLGGEQSETPGKQSEGGGDERKEKKYALLRGRCSPLRCDAKLIMVDTELELIEHFAQIIIDENPTIVTGYNIFKFDFPYLDLRLRRRLEQWPAMGKIRSRACALRKHTFESKGAGSNAISYLQMTGRICIDPYPIIKFGHKLHRYNLETVAAQFLDIHKLEMSAERMFETFAAMRQEEQEQDGKLEEQGEKQEQEGKREELGERSDERAKRERKHSQKVLDDMRDIVEYGTRDSEIPIALMIKLNMWTHLCETVNIVSVTIEEYLTRGQQIRCISQIYREASQHGYVINSMPTTEKYKGAVVVDPRVGLHDKVVIVDFAGLYPSIILAHNLCYSTLIHSDHVRYIPPEQYEVAICEEEDVKTGKISRYTYHFMRTTTARGILPLIIEKLLAERKKTKGKMKEAKGEFLKGLYNSRQLELKISANSIYGFTGVSAGVMPCIPVARTITSYGRLMIGKMRSFLETGFKHKFPWNDKPQFIKGTVIYGDTDSLMIDFGIEDAKNVAIYGRAVCDVINGKREQQEQGEMNGKEHSTGQMNGMGQVTGNGEWTEQGGLFQSKDISLEFQDGAKILCLRKKMYAYVIINEEGIYLTDEKKIVKKGVVLVRRDKCKWLVNAYSMVLRNIITGGSILKSASIIVEAIRTLIEGRVDIADLVMIKKLGTVYKGEYFIKTYADYLVSIGKPPAPDDRLEYIVTNVQGETKVGKKMRPPSSYEERKSFEPIDYMYYIDNCMVDVMDLLFSIGHSSDIARSTITYKASNRHKVVTLKDPVEMLCRMVKYIPPQFRPLDMFMETMQREFV